MSNISQIQIFLDKRESVIRTLSGNFVTSNSNPNDYFVNILLKKNVKLTGDYVNIDIDKTKAKIERQMINPNYIDFGFFERLIYVNRMAGDNRSHIYNILKDKAEDFGLEIKKG